MAIIKRGNDRLSVKCIECAHATYKQWFNNPVIAFCQAQGGETEVAEIRRTCFLFKPSKGEPSIEHLNKYEEQ